MTPRRAAGWAVAAVLVALLAFAGGRALRPGEADAAFVYDTSQPPYTLSPESIGLSKGGFSGFGGNAGLEGAAVVSGRVRTVSAGSITIETSAGASETIRLTPAAGLLRIESASAAALRPGMTVAVRLAAGGDEAAAVLIVSEP
jgi:hypothetical protein